MVHRFDQKTLGKVNEYEFQLMVGDVCKKCEKHYNH